MYVCKEKNFRKIPHEEVRLFEGEKVFFLILHSTALFKYFISYIKKMFSAGLILEKNFFHIKKWEIQGTV